MVKPNFRACQSKADALLKRYAYTKPPIDPEWIAEQEGLRVLYADFEHPDSDNISGYFELNDNSIIVNNDISDSRITFTIAHELGHYALHQEYIKSNDYRPMPRTNGFDVEKTKEEFEADQFAANLLVPLKMLKRYKDIASEGELAKLFFVSDEVIRKRLDLLERYPYLAD